MWFLRPIHSVVKIPLFPFFQLEREKTTGDAWFNMKAPELTKELKGDLKLLKMRGSMDPKRFYKKNDRDGFPKYFQVRAKPTPKIFFRYLLESARGVLRVFLCRHAGGHRGGQPHRLLSFPDSQEAEKENNGGGAAGWCRVQEVRQHCECSQVCFSRDSMQLL